MDKTVSCQSCFDKLKELEKYQEVMDHATQLIAIIDMNYTLVRANQALLDLAGVQSADVVGQPYWELPWWNHSEEIQNRIVFAVEQAFAAGTVRLEVTHRDRHGEVNEIDFHVKAVRDPEGEVLYFVAMGYNISDLVKARQALTEREHQLNTMFDFSFDGHFIYMLPEPLPKQMIHAFSHEEIVSHHKFVRWNQALLKQLGYGDEDVESMNMMELLNRSTADVNEIIGQVREKGSYTGTLEYHNVKHTEERIFEVSIVGIYTDEEEYAGCFGVIHDVTETKRYEEKLEYLAWKDPLTGLNNRRAFFDRCEEVMAYPEPRGTVLIMDIDRFKGINDRYGHGVGDIVLREVAKTIQRLTEPNGFSGRYGGEEFSAVLERTSIEKAYLIAEEIRQTIEDMRIETKEYQISCTISLGVANILETDRMIEEAITRADRALYRAKETGRNKVVKA